MKKITISEVVFLAAFVVIFFQLHSIKPQLKENYVSVQTTKLDGEIYVCGTVLQNRDKESLYCTGFTDGYSWAMAQLKMDKELK